MLSFSLNKDSIMVYGWTKNPLKKMQSLIAVACKLIRVFHVILTKGISYDATKMLKDIRHPGEQLKAA